MTKEQVLVVINSLVSYLLGEGANARKRLATKGSETTFIGTDGITRKSASKPLGAFWEIPDAMVSDLKAVSEAYKALKANRYPSFELLGNKFEIGAIDFNNLTKKSEIWFVKAGLLGSSNAISTEDLIAQLANQKVERQVTEIDTAGMTSVVSQKVTADSELPI